MIAFLYDRNNFEKKALIELRVKMALVVHDPLPVLCFLDGHIVIFEGQRGLLSATDLQFIRLLVGLGVCP